MPLQNEEAVFARPNSTWKPWPFSRRLYTETNLNVPPQPGKHLFIKVQNLYAGLDVVTASADHTEIHVQGGLLMLDEGPKRRQQMAQQKTKNHAAVHGENFVWLGGMLLHKRSDKAGAVIKRFESPYARKPQGVLHFQAAGDKVTQHAQSAEEWNEDCMVLGILDEEARNAPFCPSQEKFHTVVLQGVRNISEAP